MPPRRYTEEEFRAAVESPEADLREAIATSPSLMATLRSLGLADGGSATSALREWIEQRGIDTSHFRSWRPANQSTRRTYADDELRRALEDPAIDSFAALCDRLGLQSRSATRRRLRERAASLGLDIEASWSMPGPRRNRAGSTFDDVDAIEAAIPDASSLADILRAIGAQPHQSNYARLRRTVEQFDLDLSKMAAPRQGGGVPPIPLGELLVKGRRYASAKLRQRLVEAGLKEPRCESCRQESWLGDPIPLELDHVDGDRLNNELENLRLLCPNCHALTPTYRGRNIGRANDSSAT